MSKQSAGILLYRITSKGPEFLLVHPGGPFWAKKDLGSWSVPKGEISPGEDPDAAARREFNEETGQTVSGEFIGLSPVKQKGGKIVYCYACEGNIDPAIVKSNFFEMEWPPRSGKKASFPEVDKAMWFDIQSAREKIIEAQSAFIDELVEILGSQQYSGQ
jgi:predicted NUDIX family NTP pyrophosphohydrolase